MILIGVCVSVCVQVCSHVHMYSCSQKSKDTIRSPGAGVMCDYGAHNVHAKNQILVLYKNRGSS